MKPLLIEHRVARWWNLKPWEYRSLEQSQQAELHAIYDAEKEIEQYYDGEYARRADQAASKK